MSNAIELLDEATYQGGTQMKNFNHPKRSKMKKFALIVLQHEDDPDKGQSAGHVWGIGNTRSEAIQDGREWFKEEIGEEIDEVFDIDKGAPGDFISLPCSEELAKAVLNEGGFVPFKVVDGTATIDYSILERG